MITPHTSTGHLTPNLTDLFHDRPDEVIHSGRSLTQASVAPKSIVAKEGVGLDKNVVGKAG